MESGKINYKIHDNGEYCTYIGASTHILRPTRWWRIKNAIRKIFRTKG